MVSQLKDTIFRVTRCRNVVDFCLKKRLSHWRRFNACSTNRPKTPSRPLQICGQRMQKESARHRASHSRRQIAKKGTLITAMARTKEKRRQRQSQQREKEVPLQKTSHRTTSTSALWKRSKKNPKQIRKKLVQAQWGAESKRHKRTVETVKKEPETNQDKARTSASGAGSRSINALWKSLTSRGTGANQDKTHTNESGARSDEHRRTVEPEQRWSRSNERLGNEQSARATRRKAIQARSLRLS